ncbi:MAG: tripartite tricarboxylate transporter TctB family protein [Betaproteobacteria bacterium]|nr:tripartite tricarboxylate transporter TctB family protein [Betaproteobacteria bacterium]
MGRDGIAGLAVLAASLALFVLTLDLKDSPLVPVGPGFYPRIVLALTAVLSLGLAVADVLAHRGRRPAPAADATKLNYPLVAISFGVFALYVVALPWLGFRIATFAYVVASSSLLAPPRGAKGWSAPLILALATTVVTWLVFERWLSVLLPRGSWTDF